MRKEYIQPRVKVVKMRTAQMLCTSPNAVLGYRGDDTEFYSVDVNGIDVE